jgi:KUP system potassium uptake protein
MSVFAWRTVQRTLPRISIMDGQSKKDAETGHHAGTSTLILGALGVVYGDIGTSPLYTFKTALDWGGSAADPMGMFSLIIWTLLITTSLKYVALVMRADNDGEGGILALMALIGRNGGERTTIMALGLLGGALLYGDGAITPAISVLSALEGLEAPFPSMTPYVTPVAGAVLLGLFLLQRQGTARIGRLFGPVMVVWFLTIGLLGAGGILQNPSVLEAFDPRRGLSYLATHGFAGFLVLGAVFLCATGAEALYADMGHFGRGPIRKGWYWLVLQFLNYAGQTALAISGTGNDNPFFLLAPGFLRIPLVILATLATIIASQSIISGVFSMTRQAIQLNLCPRLKITQTSAEGYGQIYVGAVNWLLMVLTLALTFGFGSSDRLAAAFGIAVSMTMLLTSILMYQMMREVWRWPLLPSAALTGFLCCVDLSFVTVNLVKVLDGGWVPLITASLIFFVMWSWRSGRTLLLTQLDRETMPLQLFVKSVADKPRVRGSAVYLVRRLDTVPVSALHNLKHFKVLHERNVFLHVVTAQVPRSPAADQIILTPLGGGAYTLVLRYGFMETPDIPAALHACASLPESLAFDQMDTSFFVARESIGLARRSTLSVLRRRVFIFLQRNAQDATEFFRIPANRMVELGVRLEI